ncbi:disease resistance protein RPV1 [Lactuca sativa]|uniref:disease resistance protein RPV1 n=1 Tax=Lactuca sativa TaxID=4236 RepID=UPI000CD822E3|nr:disease resistance protein RPV1 [Lactuca sativa]
METRINDIVSSLGTATNDVRMIGIGGIGGGGKTTLARAVFSKISFQFEGKSLIENISEVANTSLSDLKSLQNQVLSDVLNSRGIHIRNEYEGKMMLWTIMRGRKVLLVLDDVDHINQLEALAGDPNWFKSGSIIIITTREKQVLVAHGVKLIHNVNLLSDTEAIYLFSKYTFGRDIPEGYEELSRQVVCYVVGLPLTIKVLGSFLCGKSKLEWVDALDRLKAIPLEETRKKWELNYISLDDDYKELFLDVATMLKGWPKDSVIEALESCGFYARIGLRVLEQKSLITIDDYERVGMHDHLEEMAKNIVRHALRYLCWNDYPFSSLPKIFQANNLVVVQMLDSKIVKLWEGGERKVLNKLIFIDLSYSTLRTFELGLTPNLETFTLLGCSHLVELHMSIECLKLKSLKLSSTSKLRTLDLRLTPNLEHLDFNGDSVELYMPNECLKLRSLKLSGSNLRRLDLRLTPNLENLDLNKRYNLVELQAHVGCLKNVVYLDLSGCLGFKSFLFHIKDNTFGRMNESLDVRSLAELHFILESCPFHLDNHLPKFEFTCFHKEDLPLLARNPEMLISIGPCAYIKLETFSRSIC